MKKLNKIVLPMQLDWIETYPYGSLFKINHKYTNNDIEICASGLDYFFNLTNQEFGIFNSNYPNDIEFIVTTKKPKADFLAVRIYDPYNCIYETQNVCYIYFPEENDLRCVYTALVKDVFWKMKGWAQGKTLYVSINIIEK